MSEYSSELNALIDEKIQSALSALDQQCKPMYGDAVGYFIEGGQEYRYVTLDGSATSVPARISSHIRINNPTSEKSRVMCMKIAGHLLIVAEIGFQRAIVPRVFEVKGDLSSGWQSAPYAGQLFYQTGLASEAGDYWSYNKAANEYRIAAGGPRNVNLSGASAGTAGTNFNTPTIKGFYVGSMFVGTATVTRITSNLVFTATGDVTNTLCLTLPTGFFPLTNDVHSIFSTPRSAGNVLIQQSNAQIFILSGPSNGSINNGDIVSIPLCYVYAGSTVAGI